MKQEKAGMSVFSILIGLFSAILMVSAIVMPVAAAEMTDYHEISIPMTNGARFNETGDYYFKLGGGGLNALHITDSPNSPYGQVTHATGNTGTFYISDTGGRGYDDDIILMLAVNGTIPENFTIHLKSSGYQWTPTDGTIPDEGTVTGHHIHDVVDADFGPANFTDYFQIWKPSTSSNYRIYNTQNMADPDKKFSLMFIDLKVGALGLNTTTGYEDPLDDNGMVKVEYNFTNLGSLPAAFNAYSWCHQSNQGENTVSWTNKLDGTSSGTSGWDLNI